MGFGISTPEQARDAADFADGVIIGSDIVRIAAEHGRDCVEPIRSFSKEVKQAISNYTCERKHMPQLERGFLLSVKEVKSVVW